MKTLKEWIDEQNEDPDFALVQEQASMMMTRFAGLLQGLPAEQKTALVKQIMAKFAGMTND